jgi:hypothetical protein
MAERWLGEKPTGKLSGKPSVKLGERPIGKLSGKLTPYVPRGAQYDYNPPSVFARYKVLTALFVLLLVSLFGYWVFVLRQPRAAAVPPASATPDAAVPRASSPPASSPPARTQPQADPVYIEPLPPK